jgi:hypothetical protein
LRLWSNHHPNIASRQRRFCGYRSPSSLRSRASLPMVVAFGTCGAQVTAWTKYDTYYSSCCPSGDGALSVDGFRKYGKASQSSGMAMLSIMNAKELCIHFFSDRQ